MPVAKETSALPVRGVQIDCRAQMLRYETIVEIFHDLARWGFNTVLFEYENRFPFTGRLKPAAAEDALTKTQVRSLVRLAASLGLRIMPLVHCLGHLEYVLHLPGMRRVSETPDHPAPNTVCPSHPGARTLFREMVGQVLDLHPDCRTFHMGGDEAEMNPDCPRCAGRLRSEGVSGLLAEHYVERADWLRAQGPEPIIWCDMPLRHPEAIDVMRGHLTIMDWDYWSGVHSSKIGRLWGAPQCDCLKPETWPAVHRRLFAQYILTDDGKCARPFPYAKFLRDYGFQVIVASAARSAGDTFCAPRAEHINNVIGAAKAAAEYHLLGSIVNSWALRRSPWPLTEYALIAGGMTMRNPRVSRREIDVRFAEEHFGVADPGLAEIPSLLGTQVRPYIEALPQFDPKTQGWPAAGYEDRLAGIRQDPGGFQSQLRRLRANIKRADALLAKAKPKTARQRKRVALWRWASETLSYFASVGPEVLVPPGRHDAGRLKRYRRAAQALAGRTATRLGPILTERTMREEQQTRFGIHLDYLDAMIAACADGGA